MDRLPPAEPRPRVYVDSAAAARAVWLLVTLHGLHGRISELEQRVAELEQQRNIRD